MQHETERLIRLVNELLVLTRADAGALQLNMQPIDLPGLIRARCQALSTIATGKGITLDCAADDQTNLRVQADPDRISQVIDNLLDNAIRHSSEHSTITISIQEKNAGLECAVIDRGIGIPAEHLALVFERFYRVDTSRNRKGGGTGLGLAIAKALVQAHGGHIRAESVEGQGTTISFWLPRA
jgi:signal transduction histidine kinase